GQAGQDTHDAFDLGVFAVEEGAMRFRKIALARRAVELTPGATTGMTVGPEIATPEPASVVTTGMRTKMPAGVDLTGTPVRRGHGVGRHWRRHLGKRGRLLTQGTGRLVCQARERFGLGGTLALGLRWRGWSGQAWLGPSDVQHDEEPHESE